MNKLGFLTQDTKISQRELENYVHISHSIISNLAKEIRPFREKHISLLTSFFDVTGDYLLGRTDYGIKIYTQYGDNEIYLTTEEYYKLRDNIIISIVELPTEFTIKMITKVESKTEYCLKYSVRRELLGKIEDYKLDNFINRKIQEHLSRMSSDDLQKVLYLIENIVER